MKNDVVGNEIIIARRFLFINGYTKAENFL